MWIKKRRRTRHEKGSILPNEPSYRLLHFFFFFIIKIFLQILRDLESQIKLKVLEINLAFSSRNHLLPDFIVDVYHGGKRYRKIKKKKKKVK